MPRRVSRTDTGFVQEILGKGDLTIDAWGKTKVAQDVSIYHGMWTFDIPSNMWLVFENGVETSTYTRAASVDGALSMTTLGASNDEVMIKSKRHPRYQPNRGVIYSSSIGLPNSSAPGIREFGLSTMIDGVFFRLRDGILYAVRLDNGVEYEESIKIPFAVDLSKGNIYDIQLQWRGVGNLLFFIGNPETGVSELVHEMKLLGTLDGLSLNNPALPIHFKVKSSGTVLNLWSGCVDISSEGGNPPREQYGNVIGSEVTALGTGTPLLLFRVSDMINGRTNTSDMHPYKITIYAEKKSSMNVYFTRDTTAFTGGTWTPYNGTGHLELNTTITSYNKTKMKLISTRPLESGKVAEILIPNPERIEFTMIHGDYFFIEGVSATGLMRATLEYGVEI